MVHKLFCDSRARKDGDHASWSWQPERPISVPKSRAFIDAVSLPVAWQTVNADNQYLYVTENQTLRKVLAGQGKVYVQEGSTFRIVQIAVGSYTGAQLASALSTALNTGSSGWTVAFINSQTSLGTLNIGGPANWKFFSRRELIAGAFPGVSPGDFQDSADLLGIVDAPASGSPSGNVTLAPAKAYRQIALTPGFYTATQLANHLQDKLRVGTTLSATWTAAYSDHTGRITVANADAAWEIWPETYLLKNPYLWPGIAEPYSSDNVTGLEGDAPLAGPTVIASMHVNVLRYHSVFIATSLGSHSDTIGPLGQTSFARKILVSDARGGMIDDRHMTPFDFISLEPQSLSSITFRLTDWRGRTLPMSVPWSLSIVIVPESEF